MPRQIFLTDRAVPLSNWLLAFPEAELAHVPEQGKTLTQAAGEALVWVHLYQNGVTAADRLRQAALAAPGCRLVALANTPSDDEGAAVLGAGAAGYLSALATPELLQQVADVVGRGGLWVGEDLLQRMLSALAGLSQRPYTCDGLQKLSEREREVAQAVARGESNKEIANRLGISERTVKAHLSAAFGILGVRDRLQLSILVNGIPLARPPKNLH